MLKSYLNLVYKNLRYRQVRSWLTILGVIIGVASIIALVSITTGLENSIEEQFDKIGSNKIFVMPKGTMGIGAGLDSKDVKVLEKMGEFETVIPYLVEPSVSLKYKLVERYHMVMAFPSDDAAKWWESYDIGLDSGRFFHSGDGNVILLGYKAATDLFDKTVRLNNKIEVGGEDFKVVGIVEEIGNSQDDNQVYIPLEVARDLFDKPEDVSTIEVTVKEGLDMEIVVDKLKRRLGRVKDEESFEVMTPVDILRFMGNILSVVRIVLVSIAAISLVVGAVGIMNSMYTNVLERTKEVGVMKAVGASNRVIRLFFLVEAGFIGLVGGVFGVLFGFGLAKFVGYLAAVGGFKMLVITFDPWLMLFGLVFAFIVGLVAGYLPAKQASELKIVDALSYD